MTDEQAARAAKMRVKRGAAWLDKNAPGWEERVELRSLTMSSTCKCVLGQVFRNTKPGKSGFDEGLDIAVGPVPDCDPFPSRDYSTRITARNKWAVRHGFDHDRDIDYTDLRNAWECIINERLGR